MPGSWLLLPILFPILGGLSVLGIHTLKVRRRVITLLLVLPGDSGVAGRFPGLLPLWPGQ